MGKDAIITDEAIFNDVSATINKAMKKSYDKNNSTTLIARTAF